MKFSLFAISIFFLLVSGNFPWEELTAAELPEIRCAEVFFLGDSRLVWPEIRFLEGKFHKVGKVKGPPASQQTRVKTAYDEENLYLLLSCSEENIEKVVACFTGSEIWKDDCLEIFVHPDLEKDGYFQFVVSVSGEKYGWSIDRKEITEDWSVKVTKGTDRWRVEMALPFSLLKLEPHAGNILGISFCRERRAGELELSTWTPPQGFHRPEEFGRLALGSYYDFLKLTSQTMKKSLEEILPLMKGVPHRSKTLSKVQRWQELFREAEGYIKNRKPREEEFRQWLRKWEALNSSNKTKELKYEIKLERLLNQ